MPISIKEHLSEIEILIIFYYAWKSDSSIHEIIKNYIENDSANENEMSQESSGNFSKPEKNIEHFEGIFFKRVLQYTAIHIYQLCEFLKLDENLSELVWKVMNHITSNQTQILVDRHIDQLIFCSVYAVCKINQKQISFKEILQK